MTPMRVDQAFAAQARRTPEVCAVVVGDHAATYRQLAAKAGAVARMLARRPAGPVAGYFDHSVEAVAAFLGALAAGRWYVPLAPVQGLDRVGAAMADCAAATVLTTAAGAADLHGTGPADVVCLDEGLDQSLGPAGEAGFGPAGAGEFGRDGRLAYAIYTSGSTGRPKGVLVSHAALAASTAARHRLYGDGGTLFLAAPLCFDSSVSLFAPLTSGGTVVLSSARGQDAVGLAAEIVRTRATHALLLPTVYSELLTVWGARQPPDLAVATVAGEALAPALVRRHLTLAPGRRLVNEYGPTEATVFCTAHECTAADADRSSVPIGRAVAGYVVDVLDRDARPVADGERGEICVAGPGLAEGYLGRPGLTARRFVPAPWGRWYRTGDLGVRGPDGLEYHGRVDDQVKIRGARVELSEVDCLLAALPGVVAAATIAVEGRLVGFVRLEPGARIDLTGAPLGYLTPQSIHAMPELPVTANGKTDRAALAAWLAARPAPDPSTSDSAPAPEGPLGALAGAAADVLGHRVALDEPFTSYADSLAALRTGVRLHLRGWSLDPAALLGGASLRAAATGLTRRPPEPARPSVPARPELTPLAPSQLGIWYAEQAVPGSTAFTIGLRVRLARALRPDRLRSALSTVVERHPVLRHAVEVREGRPVLVPVDPPDLDVIDLTTARTDEAVRVADELAALEVDTPIDVRREPPLRATLVLRPAGGADLLLTVHHLAVDGWSVTVLLRDLADAYDGRDTGPPPPDFLAYAAAAYADDAADAFTTQARAAADQLAGAPTVLSLRAHGRVPRRERSGRWLDVAPPLRAGLARLAVERRTTLFTVLLAGFALALAEVTGRRAFIIGTVHANRPTPADEQAVGQFANVVPIAVDLPDGADAVAHLRERVPAALRYAHVPFHRVVEAANPVRTAHTPPLVQVLFEYNAGAVPEFTVDGVTTRLSTEDLGHGAVADVSVRVLADDGRLRCLVVHDASVVAAPVADRLSDALSRAWRRLAGPGPVGQ